MRDRIGNALIGLGRRVRRTKRYEGGLIQSHDSTGSVQVMLSPGAVYVEDPAEFARMMRRHGDISRW